jgi:Protein of unknown function (DUF3618)
MTRDPEMIQREIEQTRDRLAGTFDDIADRLSPPRLASAGRERLLAAASSPPGIAVLGGVALLTALFVARRVRNRRRARS